MTKTLTSFATLLLLQSFVSLSAEAAAHHQMAAYFNQKIAQVESVLLADAAPAESEKKSRLQDINVDFAPQMSFGLSEVAKLTVTPEIDFVFVPDEE